MAINMGYILDILQRNISSMEIGLNTVDLELANEKSLCMAAV